MKFLDALNSMDSVSVVVIRCGADGEQAALASLLYTAALQKHKQVFWLHDGDTVLFKRKFAVLAWSANVKDIKYLPVSLEIDVSRLLCELSFVEIFYLLKKDNYKINLKMATALYVGLLFQSNSFLNADGTLFAVVSELMALGVNSTECNRSLICLESLADLRFRALMLQKMKLVTSGGMALFDVGFNELLTHGSSEAVFVKAAKDALCLPTVQLAVVRCFGIAGKTWVYGQNGSNLARIAKKFDALVVGGSFTVEKIVEPDEIFMEMENEKK